MKRRDALSNAQADEGSTQKGQAKQPDILGLKRSREQVNLTTTLQQVRANPRALNPREVLRLQQAVGNQAIIQRIVTSSTAHLSQASRHIIQRGNYYYGNSKDHLMENRLVGGQTTRLAWGQFVKTMGKLKDEDTLHFQSHGGASRESGKSSNDIYWRDKPTDEESEDIDPERFVEKIDALGLSGSKESVFTLDIISCFGAGTREEWDKKSQGNFDIKKTLGYRVAKALQEKKYKPGLTVKVYVGKSKIMEANPVIETYAGVSITKDEPEDPAPGWEVAFTLGKKDIGVALGTSVQKTKVGKSLGYAFRL